MRTDRGFTLLETLLALACTAVVLAAAARTVTRAADTRVAAGERAGDVDAARTALTALVTELPAALPGSVRVERRGDGPPRLHFTVADPVPAAVTWWLDDGRLVRRAPSPFAAPGATAAPPATQVEHVEHFDVRVLAGDGWTPAWSGDRPPRAIEIVVQPAGEPPMTVRVALPMGRRS